MDEDKIISKLLEHDDSFGRIERDMFTKEDGKQMIGMLEGLTTMTKKIEEDHIFSIEWLKRVQNQVEKQEEEIRQIKLKLGIV